MLRSSRSQKGMVLIFALWVLAFLTVLAVSVAAGIRQKIILVKRLDERSRMHDVTAAAIKKACVYMSQQMEDANFQYTPLLKKNLHNDTNELNHINLGDDYGEVSYTYQDQAKGEKRFGVVDEESKININRASLSVLGGLIVRVLGVKEDKAALLAQSILDWRQYGTSQQQGFFSDDYYVNLQYPYHKKEADYETLDELLLVKGMDQETYERLRPYITIYGEGKVNINTASPVILSALGLDDVVIDKICTLRRGQDGVEATLDDHVFLKTFDIATEVNAALKLELAQMHAIDMLNAQGLLTTVSTCFTVDAFGHLAHHDSSGKVRAVFSVRENKILYWKEK